MKYEHVHNLPFVLADVVEESPVDAVRFIPFLPIAHLSHDHLRALQSQMQSWLPGLAPRITGCSTLFTAS